MNDKLRFLKIYKEKIKRPGSEKLLHFLENQSDFFTAPASTRFHGAYKGGLVEHSLQVYDCLCDYLERRRVQDIYELAYSEESIAIVSLLHDLCKCDVYKTEMRNKKIDGVWQQVPTYVFDDPLPYGHGEKSVYMISGYMRLTREEAFAIRYHMGFSSSEPPNQVGKAFEMFPLALALSTADMEATYFLEQIKKHEEIKDE
ncbi:hydrolase [Sharpea azabuensis]|uniref:Hydrolase n=1 Tax=Sharpea porci TaxID=2652286 RepID=A0A844FSV8_9FIRM|nr:hydrolase [Sharpea porci]MST89091.1 hydrolase [Sharpea porci]